VIRWLVALGLLFGAAALQAQNPAASAPPSSAAKKEMVAKLLQMQRGGIEAMTRSLVERPAVQITQEAGQIARTQVAEDKRAALGKDVEARVRKYFDEAAPVLRDRALALAPSTIGVAMEEKFSEDELRQLIAWLDSPLNKKYSQIAQEMQNDFVRKLLADAGPAIEPKVQALNQDIRQLLMKATANGPAAPKAGAGPRVSAPASAASRP
jgi:hypothetical protein